MKILMVCLGNICRSPLAEGIMQHKADALGLEWEVESAGTANYHVGEAPHYLSQKVAKINGIDISTQAARQFNKHDMLKYDKIFVMDNSNLADVKRMSGDNWNAQKTTLLLDELYPGKQKNVPDPWYGTEKDFQEVFELIANACDAFIAKNK